MGEMKNQTTRLAEMFANNYSSVKQSQKQLITDQVANDYMTNPQSALKPISTKNLQSQPRTITKQSNKMLSIDISNIQNNNLSRQQPFMLQNSQSQAILNLTSSVLGGLANNTTIDKKKKKKKKKKKRRDPFAGNNGEIIIRTISQINLPSLSSTKNIENFLKHNNPDLIMERHNKIYKDSKKDFDKVVRQNMSGKSQMQRNASVPTLHTHHNGLQNQHKPNNFDVSAYIRDNKSKIYMVDGHPYDEDNSSFYVYSNNGDDFSQDRTNKNKMQSGKKNDIMNQMQIIDQSGSKSRTQNQQHYSQVQLQQYQQEFQSFNNLDDTTKLLTTFNGEDTPQIKLFQPNSNSILNPISNTQTPIMNFKLQRIEDSVFQPQQKQNIFFNQPFTALNQNPQSIILQQEKQNSYLSNSKSQLSENRVLNSNQNHYSQSVLSSSTKKKNMNIYSQDSDHERTSTPGIHEENKMQEMRAFRQFYDRYRKMDKNKQQKVTAFSKFIDKCESFGITPKPFGIVQRKHKRENINVNDLAIGDKYAQALAEGLTLFENQQSLNLKQSNLSDAGIIPIIKSIKYDLIILDISYNSKISINAYTLLFDLIDSHLSDQNKISDEGAKHIAEVLRINNRLNVLFMRWNQVKSRGAKYIVNALQTNDGLQILDASFNSFGQQFIQPTIDTHHSLYNPLATQEEILDENKNMVKLLKIQKLNIGLDLQAMFRENKALIHLDLSHNCLKREDCDLMADGLKDNHTLLGFHMIGNDMDVNSLGYFTGKCSDPSSAHIVTRIKATLHTGTISKSKVKLQASSNCWICEGWSQMEFRWNPQEIVMEDGRYLGEEIDENTLVFINLSCDNGESDLMERDEITGEFTLLRMVPPGKLTYFYSIAQPPSVKDGDKSFSLGDIQKKVIEIPENNIFQNVIQTQELITQYFLEDLTILPRPPVKKIKGLRREKTPWDFKKSVFKDYIPDNDIILGRCFDYDWSNSKLTKIIKDEKEQEQIKQYLKPLYKHLREVYKYFSGQSPNNGVPSIGQNVFQDISNNCNFLEGELMKLSDIDLEFISTNAGNKPNPLNPDRSLVRYQLMEIIVRIAIFKYFKSKAVPTIYDAVKMLFNNYALPFCKKFDCHDWRIHRLWNEECDIVFKYYILALKALFEKFSGKYSKPGTPKFMSLDEFSGLAIQAEIFDDVFGQRDLNIQFNLSMMTSVPEIDTDRHIKMSIVEFIDAFGRIADKISPQITGEDINGPEEMEHFKAFKDENWRISLVRDKKLAPKIEWLFKRCIQFCLGESFNKEFKRAKSPKKKKLASTMAIV